MLSLFNFVFMRSRNSGNKLYFVLQNPRTTARRIWPATIEVVFCSYCVGSFFISFLTVGYAASTCMWYEVRRQTPYRAVPRHCQTTYRVLIVHMATSITNPTLYQSYYVCVCIIFKSRERILTWYHYNTGNCQ